MLAAFFTRLCSSNFSCFGVAWKGEGGEGRGGSSISVFGEELPGCAAALPRGLGEEEETPTLLT